MAGGDVAQKDPEADKPKDPNRNALIAEYGDRPPVELDALHPSDLTKITRSAMESVYDMPEIDTQKARARKERELLGTLRRRVQDIVYGEWPELFAGGR